MSTTILPHFKICSKCDTSKSLAEFCKNGKAGLVSSCKTCRAAAFRKWATENKDKVAAAKKAYHATPEGKAVTAAYNKKYAIDHAERLRAKRVTAWHATKDETKEARSAQRHEYLERNRVEINRKRSAYLLSNPDYRAKSNARATQWSIDNRDFVASKGRAYYLENRARIMARVAAYQKANPEATSLLKTVTLHRRRARLLKGWWHIHEARRGKAACLAKKQMRKLRKVDKGRVSHRP